MQTAQGSLVIIGANTPDVKVYWNGQDVPGVKGIIVDNDFDTHKVVLKVQEDPVLAELISAGITIRRTI